MREPVNASIVSEQLSRLLQAFPRKAGSADIGTLTSVYYKALQELDADALRAAVDRVIQDDQYFPKVARLREVAGNWMKRNRATIYFPKGQELWNQCPICGAIATSKKVVRQARSVKAPHVLLWEDGLDAHGEPIPKLEQLVPERYDMVHNAEAHNFVKPDV